MAEIRDGLMSQHCRRIIYAHYETSNRDLRAKGSKALIYAAYAADYNYVIVYNSEPCNDQCCAATNAQGNTRYYEGKVFKLNDILNPFNIHQPQWMAPNLTHIHHQNADPKSTRSFAEHNGRHWYFCRIYTDERYY